MKKIVLLAAALLMASTANAQTPTVSFGAWTNMGGKAGCTNWAPATSTVNKGTAFTQTATDCEQDQTRTRLETRVDPKTGAKKTVVVGSEKRVLTKQTNTQTAVGVKAVEDCAYNAWSAPYSSYSISTGFNNNTSIMWKGSTVLSKGAFTDGRSVNAGGYNYKKVNLMESYTVFDKVAIYKVCRTRL
ncbi:MAG: hypothetical protein RSD49_17480 [Hafnia sp.]